MRPASCALFLLALLATLVVEGEGGTAAVADRRLPPADAGYGSLAVSHEPPSVDEGSKGHTTEKEETAEEEEEEEEEEESEPTIFTLEDFSSKLLAILLCMLILITVAYELVTEWLEQNWFKEGIAEKLMQKMVKELAILGFVSFTATVILQFVHTAEDKKMLFEYAHVLMFGTAIAYAKEIALISSQISQISNAYATANSVGEEQVLQYARSQVGKKGKLSVLAQPASSLLSKVFDALTFKSLRTQRHTAGISTFHVLKFHFLGFMGLLTTRKFSWHQYLTKAMENYVGSMIDISTVTWFLLFGFVGSTIAIDLEEGFGLVLMIFSGWLLLIFELFVLHRSEAVISSLVVEGHTLRLGGADHESSTGHAESHDLASIYVDELRAYISAQKAPSLLAATMTEMQTVYQAAVSKTGGTKSVTEHHGHHSETTVFRGGRELRLCQYALQLSLLMQCLLQALIVTMLAREVICSYGLETGLLLTIFMSVPTLFMSKIVTPLVLQKCALAHAVVMKQVDVLQEMESEHEQSGDYAHASQMLEVAMALRLTEEDLADAKIVRAKVKDLNKLGELKWRYRVVEEGQNPRDEAIKVLNEARRLVESHIELAVKEKSAKSRRGSILMERRNSSAVEESNLEKLQEEWAPELSEICQGLAVARLIFNTDRSEDGEIAKLLKEALDLREKVQGTDKMAETLNSLGMLKQKQKAHKDAEAYFLKSLELRRQLKPSFAVKEKAQVIAQSLTSLGMLWVDIGDAEASAHGKAPSQYEKALDFLMKAKDAYEEGFSEGHPKVAWAIEGIANCHTKIGDLRKADEAWEEVIRIRMKLQQGGGGKKLFAKELSKANDAKSKVMQVRAATRSKLKQNFLKAKRSSSSGGEASVGGEATVGGTGNYLGNCFLKALTSTSRQSSSLDSDSELGGSERSKQLREPLLKSDA